MKIVKKVNIDELVQLLLDMRNTTEYVDFSLEEGNTLKVRRHIILENKQEDNTNLDNISDLIV